MGIRCEPAAFHWRNRETGQLDHNADTPEPYNFFYQTGQICAPWNRLASMDDGPHPEWVQANWKQQARNERNRITGRDGVTHPPRTAKRPIQTGVVNDKKVLVENHTVVSKAPPASR